jgi:hypothetical protein
MANAMQQVEKTTGAAAAGIAKTETALERSGHAATQATGAHGGFINKLHDLIEIAYEVPQILGHIWDKAKEFGAEWIHTVGGKQRDLLGLEAMLGSRHAAIEVFEDVEHAAAKAGASVDTVMERTKNLLSAGFNIEEIRQIRKGVADLGVVMGPERAAALADQIADIGRNGLMTGRQLMALRHVLPMEDLRRQLGVTSDGMNKLLDGSKAIEAGKAVTAILKVIQDKFSGGVIGALAAKDAQTLPKVVARVKMLPELMMSALAGFDFQGASVISNVLGKIADTLDPQSPSGQRILASVRGLVDYIGELLGLSGSGGLFAELAGPNGAAKIEEMFKNTIDWIKTDAIPAVREFARAVGIIAEAVVGTASAISVVTGHGGIPASLSDLPAAEQIRLARGTLADPNASQVTKAYAKQVLQNLNVSVTVQGNASEKDAKRIGEVTAEHVGNALEQHAIQQGAY